MQMRYLGAREEFIYGSTPVKMDAYGLIDLYAEYKFTPASRLFLDLKNITDTVYEDIRGYNTRRRNFVIGFRFAL